MKKLVLGTFLILLSSAAAFGQDLEKTHVTLEANTFTNYQTIDSQSKDPNQPLKIAEFMTNYDNGGTLQKLRDLQTNNSDYKVALQNLQDSLSACVQANPLLAPKVSLSLHFLEYEHHAGDSLAGPDHRVMTVWIGIDGGAFSMSARDNLVSGSATIRNDMSSNYFAPVTPPQTTEQKILSAMQQQTDTNKKECDKLAAEKAKTDAQKPRVNELLNEIGESLAPALPGAANSAVQGL